MTDLLADWSMYQSRYQGDPYDLAQLYDPNHWTVVVDWGQVRSAVAGVILRVGIGLRRDPCFDRYLAGLVAHAIPWGLYHAYDPGLDPLAQAEAIGGWCQADPPLGLWADIEMGQSVYADTDRYLRRLDALYRQPAGIYSGGPFLNGHYTVPQQRTWAGRRLWVAGYPNYIQPAGWASYTWHQYTDRYALPGLEKPCDVSRPNPALVEVPPMPDPLRVTGCLIGGHTQSDSDIIPVYATLAAAGAPPAIIASVEDPGKCVDAAKLGVRTRVARFMHPEAGEDSDFEGGGNGRLGWDPAKRLRFQRAAIALPFRMNTTEAAAVSFVQCAGNEWDGQTVEEWLATCDVWMGVLDERDNRQAEYTAKYGKPLRLAIGIFNAGTPKTWAMYRAISRHPLWRRMAASGDLLAGHEGIAFDQPFTFLDDGGPDASGATGPNTLDGAAYLQDAGLLNTRLDYLLSLLWAQGIRLNWAVLEWYDGRRPRNFDLPGRIANLIHLDQRLAHAGGPWRALCLGYCLYEFVKTPTSKWYPQDCTLVLSDPTWVAYAASQRGRINGDNAMPMISDSDYAALVAANSTVASVLAKYKVAHAWQVGDVAVAASLPLTTYTAPAGAVHDVRPTATYDLNVIGVSPDGLWLEVAPSLWVKTSDVKLKGG